MIRHGSDFNWLGVYYVSDALPDDAANEVIAQMDALKEEAYQKFEAWLDERGLEQVMGVIVKKGSVPQPKATFRYDFTRDGDYRIYHPSADRKFTRYTIFHEKDLNTPLAAKVTMTEALRWVAGQS